MDDPGLEIELKLAAGAGSLDAIAAAIERAGGRLAARDLDATYFDTPALDLHRAGLSLRIRRAGDRRVQTVKAEGADLGALFARSEWEMPVDDDTPVLDDRAGPVRALLGDATPGEVRPAFTVRVTRRLAEVAHASAVIEVVVDEGVVAAAGAEDTIAEVELELKSGPPAAIFALARLLGEAAPLRLGVLAKSDRGYRLLDGTQDKPARAAHGVVAPGSSAGDAFVAIAGACLRQFRINEDLLVRTRDPHALHQARVALRRLRSALSIFRRIVADDRFEPLRTELRWLAATLGEARDIDVLLARTGEQPTLRAERERAYDAVIAALASPRTRGLMLDLAEWLAVAAWRADTTRVERFAADALERLRRRVKTRGKHIADLDDEGRHDVRIAAKKLRYAAEFFSALFPGDKAQRRARAFIGAMEDLQGRLGELNDLATAPVLAERLGLPAPPVPTRGDRRKLIRQAADAYDALIDRKRFWR